MPCSRETIPGSMFFILRSLGGATGSQASYVTWKRKDERLGSHGALHWGNGHIGNQFWLVAQHGMKAGYVRNIERDPHVRLKLSEGFRFRWHAGTAHLLPDDDPRERQRWLAGQVR